MTRALPVLGALIAVGCGAAHDKAAGPPTVSAPGSIVFAGDVERDGVFQRGYFAVAADGTDLRRLAFPEELFSQLSFSVRGGLAALSIMQTEEGGTDVFVSRADVWKPQRILPTDRAFDAAMAPDGKSVAVVYTPSQDGQAANVWVVSTEGRDLRQVTHTGGAAGTAWSPDGGWIAFTDDGEARENDATVVYVVRPDGTGFHRIPGEYASLSRPAWSPDGTQIVLEDLEGRLVVVDAGGRDKRVLTSSGTAPAWSPDGKWIAFARSVPADEEGLYETHLMVAPAEGGAAETILTIDAEYGAMSWTTARLAPKPS
jgi:Tol biopolymer transport system component